MIGLQLARTSSTIDRCFVTIMVSENIQVGIIYLFITTSNMSRTRSSLLPVSHTQSRISINSLNHGKINVMASSSKLSDCLCVLLFAVKKFNTFQFSQGRSQKPAKLRNLLSSMLEVILGRVLALGSLMAFFRVYLAMRKFTSGCKTGIFVSIQSQC